MRKARPCANQRGADHVIKPGFQRDDQLRRVAKGRVEQTAEGVASAVGDLLGAEDKDDRRV